MVTIHVCMCAVVGTINMWSTLTISTALIACMRYDHIMSLHATLYIHIIILACIHTYIQCKYSDFLVCMIYHVYVGLASACPNYRMNTGERLMGTEV